MLFRLAVLAVISVALLTFSHAVEAQTTAATTTGTPTIEKRSFTDSADPADSRATISTLTSVAERAAKAAELNNLGARLAKEGRNEEAAIIFKEAVGYDHKLANAYLNLSIVYDRLDRHEDSLAAAYSAVDARPDWMRARVQVCQTLLYLGRSSDSLECYRQTKKLGILDEIALEGYGAALMSNGKFSEAIPVLEQIAQTKPNDAKVRTALGVAQFKEKKYSEAVESFKKAIELAPDAPQPRYNLAIACLAQGDRAEALNQFRYLQTADPVLAKELFNILFKHKLLVVKEK